MCMYMDKGNFQSHFQPCVCALFLNIIILTYTVIHDSVSKCSKAPQQFLAYSLTFKIFIHFAIRKNVPM